MTVSITIDKQDLNDLNDKLREIQGKLTAGDFQELLSRIGLELLDRIELSFDQKVDPDGQSWQPLKASTLRLRKSRGNASSTILEESGRLRYSTKAAITRNSLTIGSSVPYAGVQQFGNPGNTLRGHPAPIPPRRFLPIDDTGNLDLSRESEAKIDEIIDGYLSDLMREL